MRRLIKILAIWFIVIAFPLQGLAAATMVNCEQPPNHHSQTVAFDHHHDQISDSSISDHAHDTVNACDHATHSKDKSKHSCAHCVKCTSCCSGFTFQTITPNPFQQANTNEVRFSDSPPLLTGFIPSGLERPPRSTLI